MNPKYQVAMAKYLALLDAVDRDVERARKLPGYVGCPLTCADCCHAASILPVGVAEMEHLLDGFAALPDDVRAYVLDRARRAVALLEAHGVTPEGILSDPLGRASDLLDGRPEAPCPFLVGGVCSVYAHRPLICRVWGTPIFTGKGVDCCPKTFRERTIAIDDAVPYLDYWRKARTLSGSIEKEEKEPMAFLLLRKWAERRRRTPLSDPL